MAKSIVLYGVFLGAFICLCVGLGCSHLGTRSLVNDDPMHTVNLSNKQVFGANDINTGLTDQIEGLNCNNWGMNDLGDDVRNPSFMTRDCESIVRSVIQKIYTAEIGVREKTGKNDGKRVEEYLAVTNLGKGYAWCAAFVSWVFSEAGFSEPRTPWSPALFPKDRVIWERGKSSIPAPADIFGIYFSNLKRIAHCGFVDEWGDKYVITTEGNTNEAGSNEGDGVYRKRRPISSIYQVANWIGKEGVE